MMKCKSMYVNSDAETQGDKSLEPISSQTIGGSSDHVGADMVPLALAPLPCPPPPFSDIVGPSQLSYDERVTLNMEAATRLT